MAYKISSNKNIPLKTYINLSINVDMWTEFQEFYDIIKSKECYFVLNVKDLIMHILDAFILFIYIATDALRV